MIHCGPGRHTVRRCLPALTVSAKPSERYAVRCVAGRRLGTAVRRNALKRRVREAWRRKFVSGDFTFVLKPPLARMSHAEVFALLDDIASAIPWRRR